VYTSETIKDREWDLRLISLPCTQRKLVTRKCYAHFNAHKCPQTAHKLQKIVSINVDISETIKEIGISDTYSYRLIQKKFAHAHFNAHKPRQSSKNSKYERGYHGNCQRYSVALHGAQVCYANMRNVLILLIPIDWSKKKFATPTLIRVCRAHFNAHKLKKS